MKKPLIILLLLSLTVLGASCKGCGCQAGVTVPDEEMPATQEKEGEIVPSGTPEGNPVVSGVCSADQLVINPANDTNGNGLPDCIESYLNASGGTALCEATGLADTNGNGIPDCIEPFLPAPLLSASGAPLPGCTAEAMTVDTDRDGWPDCADNCDAVLSTDQTDTDGDGLGNICDDDDDNDGILDGLDNCELVGSPFLTDTDGDGLGDACDEDIDGDGILNNAPDNCPLIANSTQLDGDADGWGDVCDDETTPLDTDGDGCADLAEADMDVDGDGVVNEADIHPGLSILKNRKDFTWVSTHECIAGGDPAEITAAALEAAPNKGTFDKPFCKILKGVVLAQAGLTGNGTKVVAVVAGEYTESVKVGDGTKLIGGFTQRIDSGFDGCTPPSETIYWRDWNPLIYSVTLRAPLTVSDEGEPNSSPAISILNGAGCGAEVTRVFGLNIYAGIHATSGSGIYIKNSCPHVQNNKIYGCAFNATAPDAMKSCGTSSAISIIASGAETARPVIELNPVISGNYGLKMASGISIVSKETGILEVTIRNNPSIVGGSLYPLAAASNVVSYGLRISHRAKTEAKVLVSHNIIRGRPSLMPGSVTPETLTGCGINIFHASPLATALPEPIAAPFYLDIQNNAISSGFPGGTSLPVDNYLCGLRAWGRGDVVTGIPQSANLRLSLKDNTIEALQGSYSHAVNMFGSRTSDAAPVPKTRLAAYHNAIMSNIALRFSQGVVLGRPIFPTTDPPTFWNFTQAALLRNMILSGPSWEFSFFTQEGSWGVILQNAAEKSYALSNLIIGGLPPAPAIASGRTRGLLIQAIPPAPVAPDFYKITNNTIVSGPATGMDGAIGVAVHASSPVARLKNNLIMTMSPPGTALAAAIQESTTAGGGVSAVSENNLFDRTFTETVGIGMPYVFGTLPALSTEPIEMSLEALTMEPLELTSERVNASCEEADETDVLTILSLLHLNDCATPHREDNTLVYLGVDPLLVAPLPSLRSGSAAIDSGRTITGEPDTIFSLFYTGPNPVIVSPPMTAADLNKDLGGGPRSSGASTDVGADEY